jgi:hypothetical protein
MELHIAAWILVNWLLAVAWLDSTKPQFCLWAGLVLFLWWIAWYRRNPPWPENPSQRLVIYVIFTGSVLAMAIFIGNLLAYLVLFEVILLWAVEILLRRRTS